MAESSDARNTSVPTAASRLLAAADIWSTEATQPLPAPPPAEIQAREPIPAEPPAPVRARPRASEVMAAFKTASSINRPASEPTLVPAGPAPPARKLSLALQGGGSPSAFTWGVLDRLLEAPDFDVSAISGASAGAINAALLASGLAEGGREGARRALARFWTHITEEASFRSLMLIG